MKKLLIISILAVALLACTSDSNSDSNSDNNSDNNSDSTSNAERAPAQSPADTAGNEQEPRWVVRPERFGPVRFGAPLPAVSAVIGEEVRPTYADFETCDYVRPKALPAHTMLMVINDTVMRVDVDSVGVRTAEGAQVGDSETSVLELYRGRISVEPHAYTGPEGHYLVVSSPGDTLHRIIFETDGQRVTGYRAGRRPAVEYVEGCA